MQLAMMIRIVIAQAVILPLVFMPTVYGKALQYDSKLLTCFDHHEKWNFLACGIFGFLAWACLAFLV